MRSLIFILALLLTSSWGHSSTLFREASPKETGITWTHTSGFTKYRYLPETAGSGVAIFDYNNDGWMDILFVNSGDAPFYKPATPPKFVLYRNNGNGTFMDVTERAGITADFYGQGIAIGDYDGDGYEDIFISGYGKCALYHNNGDGTFTDVTASSGIAAPKWGTSALWFDYDNDGKLDLFIGEFADYSSLRVCQLATSYGGAAGSGTDEAQKKQSYYCTPEPFPAVPSHLYRNLGNGHFADVSASTGIASNPGKAWGVVATDVNHDGYMDLFVSNDTMPNFLWVNHNRKTFEEMGLEAGVAYSADGMARSGMGVDAGDFDNDGRPDLLVTNIDGQNTSLYRNLGGDIFQDLNLKTGLASTTRMLSGWGIRFLDYDNDGWLDVFEVDSHPDDLIDLRHRGVTYREPIVLLRNIEGTKLQNVSNAGGTAFSQDYAARGLATGDLNNDGYPDIVFTVVDGPPHILINNAESGDNWLGLQLKARKANPAAIGAVIKWSIDGKIYSRIKTAGGGFLSSSDPREIIGAGKKSIDWLEVQWPAPSHSIDRIDKPAMDRYLTIVEGSHPNPTQEKSFVPHVSAARLVLASAQASPHAPLWKQAEAAFGEGRFKEARDLLLRAVKLHPKNASLWFYLGASYSELNDVDGAISAFEKAEALSPKQSQTYFNLGLLYWRRGELGKAKASYQSGLALAPMDQGALQNYSLLLMKTGDSKDAIAPLLLLKKESKLTLQVRAALIECYLKIGDSSDADLEADELLLSDHVSPADQTTLAAMLVELGAPTIAERVLKNSLALDPGQAKANAALGGIYSAQKKYDEAADYFQKALRQAPDSSEYALAVARTLYLWHHKPEMLAFLKSTESQFGKLPQFQYALALAYYGVTQFSDSVAVLENLLKTNSRRQDKVYCLLGNSYFQLGEYKQAADAYKQAIQINPKESPYYALLATVLRKEGSKDIDAAMIGLNRAHQLEPNNPYLELQLALCYESKGDLAAAANLIEDSIKHEPNLTSAHVALVRIYFRMGKKSEAEREKVVVKELTHKAQQQKIIDNSALLESQNDE